MLANLVQVGGSAELRSTLDTLVEWSRRCRRLVPSSPTLLQAQPTSNLATELRLLVDLRDEIVHYLPRTGGLRSR